MTKNKFKKASQIQWKWLGRPVRGEVIDVYFKSVTRTIKGSEITRHGSEKNPAYLVKSESGNLALKLESELQLQNKKTRPSMFK